MPLTTQFKRNWIRSTAIPIIRVHQPGMLQKMQEELKSDYEIEEAWKQNWGTHYAHEVKFLKLALMPQDN